MLQSSHRIYSKKTQEVLDFLQGNSGQSVCGRVNKSHLQPIPIRVSKTVRERLRIFSVALYLVFGAFLFTGCGSKGTDQVVGEMCVDSTMEANSRNYNDSVSQAQKLLSTGDTVKQDSVAK